MQLGHSIARAEIIKVFEPFTLSCVMVVRIQKGHEEPSGPIVLKAYDRRFATQSHREAIRVASPWSIEIEQQYRQFIQNGDAEEYIIKLSSENGEDSEDGKDLDSDKPHCGMS